MSKDTSLAKADTKKGLVAYDFGADAGAGIADASQAEMAIPFITILQALSPQVDGDSALEGAKSGMIFNTVTGQMVDGKEGIAFVPATRQHVFVEWVPRGKGGGFVAMHAPNSEVVLASKQAAQESGAEFGKLVTAEGNDLIETFYLYGVTVESDGTPTGPAVIAFKSMFIKKYKQTISKLRYLLVAGPQGSKVNPPIYANQLLVKSIADSNKKGKFYNFDIGFLNGDGLSSLMAPTDPAYEAAKDLKASIDAGTAKADHASTTNDSADTEDGGKQF
jgi:hypothetical protein